MKHSTQYLYDCEPTAFTHMKYVEAIKYKIERARLLIGELLQAHYTVRNDQRVHDVFNAIKFNESLLKELS